MRILITGVTGFAGGYLAEALHTEPATELFGISRQEHGSSLPLSAAAIQFRKLDLCDTAEVVRYLQQVQPEQIYHLAGYASVGQSFQEPEQAWRANVTATRSLYQAVAEWGGCPRILYVGSGLAYGDPQPGKPVLTEDSPFYPAHPYAVSKAAADLISYQCFRHPGLPIIRARPFNHIGPRQSQQFALPHFARQIVAIEQERQEPVLHTGNLHSHRDFTDVRDVVRAYMLLMQQGQPGEAYNIASEKIHCMADVLHLLLNLVDLDVAIHKEAHLLRAAEPTIPQVCTAKIRQITGWQPRYSLEQSLRDILAYWRGQPRQLTYS